MSQLVKYSNKKDFAIPDQNSKNKIQGVFSPFFSSLSNMKKYNLKRYNANFLLLLLIQSCTQH